MSNNSQMYSVPYRCRDYPDYLRTTELAELLNRENNDFPLVISLGSGPKDPKAEGVRFVDIQCASGAKIQHFIEIATKLDEDIKTLERLKKLKLPVMDQPKNPLEGLFDPATTDAIAKLREYQNMLRNYRTDREGGEGPA